MLVNYHFLMRNDIENAYQRTYNLKSKYEVRYYFIPLGNNKGHNMYIKISLLSDENYFHSYVVFFSKLLIPKPSLSFIAWPHTPFVIGCSFILVTIFFICLITHKQSSGQKRMIRSPCWKYELASLIPLYSLYTYMIRAYTYFARTFYLLKHSLFKYMRIQFHSREIL